MVGAGAAGLTTAIAAGRARGDSDPPSIVLLDSRQKIGAKILISGGTRCNVTNRTVAPSDYNGAASHYVKHALAAFTPAQTIGFFKEIGIELVVEPTGKYFPTTHSGKTVLDALTKELERVGVPLWTEAKVSGVEVKGKGFELSLPAKKILAKRIVLCTGGLSLPETGSDGGGLRIAEALGHTIVPTFAALTPLLSDDKDWRELSGLTLDDVRLDFYAKGKKQASARGGFLFTHFGFSGPAALDISRHFASSKAIDRHIEADFTPSGAKVPKRLYETLRKKCGAETDRRMRRYLLEVNGVYGYKKAEATAGGVDLKEVNISTLESKKVPGLYFAGEILDVDGRIGGFNFQWAWSTGMIAGRSVVKGL